MSFLMLLFAGAVILVVPDETIYSLMCSGELQAFQKYKGFYVLTGFLAGANLCSLLDYFFKIRRLFREDSEA